MLKTENIMTVNFDLIKQYFGKEKETLMNMSLGEIAFLMEQSSEMQKEDSIGYKLKNKIPIWKKFYTHYDNFIELGFSEEELNIGLANLGRDSTFIEKIHVHAGRKPQARYYEFISTGTASFPVPRSRSGKTEVLPADFYNVSASRTISSFSADLFEFLIKRKMPFLLNYEINVYSLDFYNKYNEDVYVKLSKDGSLYVPIKALFALDKNLVIERMVDYFDKSTKGSYGKSEELLSDPIAIQFFKDMELFKKDSVEKELTM